MPLDFTRIFSPTLSGPLRNSAILLSLSTCSASLRLSSSDIFPSFLVLCRLCLSETCFIFCSRYPSRSFLSCSFREANADTKSCSSLRAFRVSSFAAWDSLMVRIVFSTLRLALLTMSSASALASSRISFLIFFMSSSSFWYFPVMSSRVLSVCLIFCSFSSRARLFLAILRRFLSIPTNSSPALVSASFTMASGSPIFLASSNANELPGNPISSLNNGTIFLASNCIAPFTTPVSLPDAYSFRFV